MMPRAASPWFALAVAVALFVAASLVARAVLGVSKPSAPWVPLAVMKGAMLAACLAAAHASGLGADALGFRAPVGAPWVRGIAGGLALGAAATALVLLSAGSGLRSMMKGYSFGQMVLWIWLVSSLVEEIFCRGWFQSWTLGANQATNLRALLPSALLFGAMHLTLLASGADVKSVTVLVPAVTLLGLLAAWTRATSGSLYPAFAVHSAFNVGGVIGGVIYALATGRLPR